MHLSPYEKAILYRLLLQPDVFVHRAVLIRYVYSSDQFPDLKRHSLYVCIRGLSNKLQNMHWQIQTHYLNGLVIGWSATKVKGNRL